MNMNDEKILKNLFYMPEICSKCKGLCCQQGSYNCSPLDFDNDVTKMEKALETGNYSIDFARNTADSFYRKEGYIYLDINHVVSINTEVFYMKERNQNRPIVDIIHENDNEGPYVFWSYEKEVLFPMKIVIL